MSNINMNVFITILVFICILLIYLHFMAEFKYVKAFTVYDVEYESRKQLQKICELKQPFVFELGLTADDVFNTSQNMCVFDNSDNEYVQISYESLIQLLTKDKNGQYYSMGNNDFAANELPIAFSELHNAIKPYFSYKHTYDVLMGAQNAYTPIHCVCESGEFIFVKSGKISVKMLCYDKELNTNLCLWNEEDPKCEVQDVFLTDNQCLFCPTWCYYTLQFDKDAIVYKITYQSPTNLLINAPTYAMDYLQSFNVEEKVLQTVTYQKNEDVKEDEEENESIVDNETVNEVSE